MKSVADDLRVETRERAAKMTPGERVALTARLAADDVRMLAAARQLPEDAARKLLAERRRVGRHPSGAIDALDRP